MKKNRIVKITSCIMVMMVAFFGFCSFSYAQESADSTSLLSVLSNLVGTDSDSVDSDDEELDDTEDQLEELGFDTSELPEDYDPDSDENPEGADVSVKQMYGEILSVHENSGTLYGEDNALDDSYDTFYAAKASKDGLSSSGSEATAAAAGSFDGNGRKADMAYVSLKASGDKYDVEMRIYDSSADKSSEAIKLAEGLDINSITIKQSIIDISTGDYDGDSMDEIAVVVPSQSSSSCSGKIAIYELKSDELDITDTSSWKETWTYSLPSASGFDYGFWNQIDICSGDVNSDKTDDMIVSWGRVYVESATKTESKVDADSAIKSTSVLLMGDDNGKMLRNSQTLSYGDNELCRVAFTIADYNSDGNNEVFMGGQILSQAIQSNHTRIIGCYKYSSSSSKLVADKIQNINVVGTDNGYDSEYLSIPAMKANIAVSSIYGKSEDSCIYLDSGLYTYKNGFSIVDELDDQSHKDSSGNEVTRPFHGSLPYIEYNASGNYYAGATSQGISLERVVVVGTTSSRYISSLIYAKNQSTKTDSYTSSVGCEISKKDFYDSGTLTYSDGFHTGNNYMAVVDTDKDSTVMKYTGNHSFAYSSPQVYAVLASAPYFNDVAENADGGEDIKGYSNTSWGQTDSHSESDGWSLSTTAQFHYESDIEIESVSIDIGGTASAEHTEGTTKEYDMTYSTVAGEDCVVFYSIPAAVYEYEVEYTEKDSSGNYVPKKKTQDVIVPYQPVSQTITMETYNEILAKSGSDSGLPQLDGTAITSKAGYPETYPSSTSELKNASDIIAYKGNWSAPSYSTGGDVSQEIDVTKDTDDSYSAGVEFDYTGAIGFDLAKAGITLNVEWCPLDHSESNSVGTSAGGTVYNMVPEAKGYGYYFSWKLLTYTYTSPDGTSFPVVTYLTKDVTTPPAVPDDFSQNYENTTDDQIALDWTYGDDNITSFDIYRHYEFTDGSGDELVGTVKASDYTLKKNKAGELVYDDDGKAIHEYSFTDTGLSPYTEYEYSIQVNRSKVPPKSITSKTLTAKTRAEVSPELGISDSDLTVYYDTIKTVSVDAKESDSFVFKNKSFQWQKFNDAKDTWEDIDGADSSSYKFSKCSLDDEGEYRCRMNTEITAMGNVYRLTVYSDTLNVKFAKRNVTFGDIQVKEGTTSTSFSITVRNSGDGARTEPQGYIYFTLDSGQDTQTYRAKIDSDTNTASCSFDDLESGAYELSTRYVGNSKIFKNARNPETFTYLKNETSGKWVSVKKSYKFGEDLMDTLKLYKLEENGLNSANREDITSEITEIKLYYTDGTDYADVPVLSDGTAVIPAILDSDVVADESYDIDQLQAKIYCHDELVGTRTLTMKKADISLYVDNYEEDAGSPLTIDYKDIKIKGGAFEEGSNPFGSSVTGGLQAFCDTGRFNIGVYTGTGELIGCLQNPEDDQTPDGYTTDDTSDTGTIDISTLSPGSYILKVLGGTDYNKKKTVEEYFYNIEYPESELVLLGDSYYITAYGEKDNGRDVGSVTLISPDEADNVTNLRYQGGTSLTFKAHPATNYAVSYWIVKEGDKETIVDQASNTMTYKVKGVDSKITVSAVFSLIENHISTKAIGGGEVSCTSDDIGNDPIIPEGKDLTFEAKAKSGYEFVEWRYVTVDGKTTVKSGTTAADKSSSTVTVTMGSTSAVVYAIFQRQNAEISLADHLTAYYLNTSEINANLADGTELKVNAENKVPKGATVIIRPEAGYIVDGDWTVDGVNADSIKNIESGTAIKFTVPETADKITVNAATEAGSYGITTGSNDNSAEVKVRLNDEETTDYDSVDGGTTAEFTAVPKRGYVFKNWKINNKVIENTSGTYTTYITKNMNVVAVCEPVEAYEIKASIKGSGSTAYEIETSSGKLVKGSFDSETTIPVYEGESISFETAPADSFMASYIILNGTREEHPSTSYTISDISASQELVIGIDPAIYHRVSVKNNTSYQILTKDGLSVSDKITLGNKESYTFTVKGPASEDDVFVTLNGEAISGKAVDGGYEYVLESLEKDSELIIDAHKICYIETEEQLYAYLESLRSDGNINAKLMANLTPDEKAFESASGSGDMIFTGTFDGNGYKISGTSIGTWDSPESVSPAFTGLFKIIGKGGVVKNLTIENCSVHKNNNYVSLGFITSDNRGTIENCMLYNVSASLENEPEGFKSAVSGRTLDDMSVLGIGFIAGDNDGTISNCSVVNAAGSLGHNTAIGGISSVNTGTIDCCYAENIGTKELTSRTSRYSVYGLVGNPEFTRSGKTASITDSYIDNGADYQVNAAGDGINVWTDGDRMSTGRVAYLLNNANSSKVWGICDNSETTVPVLIDSRYTIGGDSPVAPVQIRLSGYKTYYNMPGAFTIPDESVTGSKGWTDGTHCYGAGTKNVDVQKDITFSKMETSPETYICSVTYNSGTLYFTDLEDAIESADSLMGDVTIDITDDCQVNESIEISSEVTVNVAGNASLAINDSATLENNGTINLADGAKIENYGGFQNNSPAFMIMESGSSFLNSGAFKNYGTITCEKGQITCTAHSWGPLVVTQPTSEKPGEKTRTCEACGQTKTTYFSYTSSSLNLSPEDLKITEGSTGSIVAVLDSDTCTGKVAFASDNEDVATVAKGDTDKTALVAAVAIGTATITATYTDEDTTLTKEAVVTVVAADSEHTYGDLISAVPATCTEDGMEAYYECPDCGGLFDADLNATTKEALVIKALGHDYGQLIPEVDSTLDTDGMKAHYVCSRCGAYFDENKEPASEKDLTIPAKKEARAMAAKVVTARLTYNGEVQKPAVVVTDVKGNVLDQNNYYIHYNSQSKNVGNYTVSIYLKNGYEGALTARYSITPKGTSIRSISAKSKGFKVKWKKQSARMAKKRISGYQIRYSLSKNMSKSKTLTVKGYKKTSKTKTKLSKKKTYYVQIRTYSTSAGQRIYSGWSKQKKVKTK